MAVDGSRKLETQKEKGENHVKHTQQSSVRAVHPSGASGVLRRLSVFKGYTFKAVSTHAAMTNKDRTGRRFAEIIITP
ncbi:MAG: hypothetical protein FWH21_03065 [Kiritimatiellaeota bacterium]|nr:hypothetical protein [Kiritimatiellota bacterium]